MSRRKTPHGAFPGLFRAPFSPLIHVGAVTIMCASMLSGCSSDILSSLSRKTIDLGTLSFKVQVEDWFDPEAVRVRLPGWVLDPETHRATNSENTSHGSIENVLRVWVDTSSGVKDPFLDLNDARDGRLYLGTDKQVYFGHVPPYEVAYYPVATFQNDPASLIQGAPIQLRWNDGIQVSGRVKSGLHGSTAVWLELNAPKMPGKQTKPPLALPPSAKAN